MAKIKSHDLFGPDYSIRTSSTSSRKYPNVLWFPRSKTDPREIREVLKIAKIVQGESKDKTFNDKSLGTKMAHQGSINVIGLKGKKYIDSYKGKSTGDISYITNARMLMRLFRFWGFVTRVSKGNYKLTLLGELYTHFEGDFPSLFENEYEEDILLRSLSDFSIYSVNDDPIYRNSTFRLRPFIWLLKNLSLEPQCIHQLIVTCFASRYESNDEINRILKILKGLRDGTTTLKKEWINLELDPDDYSCVHNFYDSAKILVYLGKSLGLITDHSNPVYGKKISGNAKQLKQATKFYELTEKGKEYLEEYIDRKPLYYDTLFDIFGNDNVIQVSFILSSLNFVLGSKSISSIKRSFIESIIKVDIESLIEELQKINISIELDDEGFVYLKTPLSFNFWQSVPPEIFFETEIYTWYHNFLKEFFNPDSTNIKIASVLFENKFAGKIVSEFILTDKISYKIPTLNSDELVNYVKYTGMENVYGGSDRFSSRKSPSNSVHIYENKIHVDNEKDALDLIIPLGTPDESLLSFIDNNFRNLLTNFINSTDEWEKDQHYTWVRNCFRLFGCKALYTGSGGMLSRADVSIIDPFISGLEIKSPRENRGTINTKAVRQAVDAKIQVADAYPEKKNLSRIAIAVGRRISPLAIKEEKKWANEGQPVLLIHDIILYYLSLRSVFFSYTNQALINLFTTHSGVLSLEDLKTFFIELMSDDSESDHFKKTMSNIDLLKSFLS